ncbi:hypothetical protein INR49_004139 [Caranx melampygus]|nr:hypothetical protein INR49_004139 [Caranx melampygus]
MEEVALWNFPHQCSSARENENVPSRSMSCCSPVQSSPSSISTSLIHWGPGSGAVAHVLRVELHLDGDAVETKLGVEQVLWPPAAQTEGRFLPLKPESRNNTVSLFTLLSLY